ncbi:MAG: hypothetical protein RR248_02665 [Clostridia bacterium]
MSKIDYKQIKLENERSTHLTKRLNRLSIWGFFKVLYRNEMIKLMLSNLFFLLFAIPCVFAFVNYTNNVSLLTQTLPSSNAFGIGSAVWLGVGQETTSSMLVIGSKFHLWLTLALCAFAFVFSGGFAVVRDAFWTGKITFFKSFWLGIKSNLPYTIICTALLSCMYFGIYVLQNYILTTLPLWAMICILVVAYILLVLLIMYCLILFSVTNTYKQSVGANLKDAWLLLWMNILPNFVQLIIMALPAGLLAGFATSFIGSLAIMFFFMIGAFYMVFVWSTHMMRTFALFHPIDPKAKA